MRGIRTICYSQTRMKRSPLLVFLFLGACGVDDFATSSSELAPAGSDVAYLSNTVPTVLAPGERVNVTVRARNDGATSPANDWGVGDYALYQQNTTFQATAPRVLTNTPVGAVFDYRVVITAPATPGPHTFAVRSQSLVPGERGYFGPTLSVAGITTDATRRPRWGCGLAGHDVPAQMAPDEIRQVNVTVINTGTEDWATGEQCLRSRDVPSGLFGASTICVSNSALVPGTAQGAPLGSGSSHTFTMTIRAPSTPGSYRFTRQMYERRPWSVGGVGFYRIDTPCVDVPVNVQAPTGPFPFDAAFDAANSDLPAQLAPGEVREVTVRMVNVGTSSWPSNGTITAGNALLRSVDTPVDRWGSNTIVAASGPVPPSAFEDFTFAITAPTTPGVYPFDFQMFGTFAPSQFFGDRTAATITVASGTTPAYDADVAAEDYDVMSPLRPGTFRITMRNIGTATWVAGQYTLESTNTPRNLFGASVVALAQDVPPGGVHQFVFEARAPQNPNIYASRWRMRHPNASVGTFGDETSGYVTVLVSCGDQKIDMGEQCDDGNTVGGDGCSAGCQLEP